MEKRVFNLLKPLEPPLSLWDKIYNWILKRARVVILVAELIIVVAFVGKVIEDTNARNKDKQIENTQNELRFYSAEIEPGIRKIQTLSNNYMILWNNSSSHKKILNEIYSYIPNLSSELTVKIDGNKVSIFGYSDLSAIRDLENSLKNSDSFSVVYIDTLTLEQQEIIENKGQYVLICFLKDSISNHEKI